MRLNTMILSLALGSGLAAPAHVYIENNSSKNWRFVTDAEVPAALFLEHHAYSPAASSEPLKSTLVAKGETCQGTIGPGSSVTFQVDGDANADIGFWLEDHRGGRRPFTVRALMEQAIGAAPVRRYSLIQGWLPAQLAAGAAIGPGMEVESLSIPGSEFRPLPGPPPPGRPRFKVVERKEREEKHPAVFPREGPKDEKAAWPEPEPFEAQRPEPPEWP